MGDPVVSPFVGIAMGIPGLVNLSLQLLEKWKEFFRAVKTSERDGELLHTKFSHLTQRYTALRRILFEDKKFDFVNGRVFDHLDPEQQRDIRIMFLELVRLLYAIHTLRERRNLTLFKPPPTASATDNSRDDALSTDNTLSPEDLMALFSETSLVPRHGRPRLRLSWTATTWAASNKKHVELLLTQFEDWLNRIRETMEDFWYPLSFFQRFSNLQTLQEDQDAQSAGLASHSNLRKFILDDAVFAPTLELKADLGKLDPTSLPLRKLGTLRGQRVLVEAMPYTVDKRGFLPPELRRRFCSIAALLNVEDVPDLRVLRCLYWREGHKYDTFGVGPSFQLISALPVGTSSEFKTLSELLQLLRRDSKPSLNSRLLVCLDLAQTISQCLSIGWRHRSIRSNNILFFIDSDECRKFPDLALASPYLCGFEESRLQDDYSMKSHGDNTIEANVYRRPDRWGTPKADFDLYHDVYSFGVILLEVGLWEPVMDVLQRRSRRRAVSELSPAEVQERLLDTCKAELSHKCGTRYTAIAEMCLKSDFGVDKRRDTMLQTEAQVVFRDEVLAGLAEQQEALAARS